ncbi:MAG: PHP domain-containing protein [Tissierellaceae bacterium]
MKIDCHIHEDKYSSDSKLDLYEAIKEAKNLGLDGICITNHDNNLLNKEIGNSAVIDGVLVIVGAEILTFEGDILTFGLKKIPDKMIKAEELLGLVKDSEGVAIAAHPFRDNNRGIEDNMIRLSHLLSAVEAFNGSTKYEHNMQAFNLANELKLPTIGASDAHSLDRVGIFATQFKSSIRDDLDFIEAIKSGDYYPIMRTDEKEKSKYIRCS